MAFMRCLVGSGAVLASSFGIAAADVSAADVWADWQTTMLNYGTSFNPGVQRSDGSIFTIEGAQIEGILEDGSYTFDLPNLTMVENGDGTVTVTTDDRSTVTAVFPTDMDKDGEVVLTVDSTNYQIIASGAPEELLYDFSADSVVLSATEMTIGNLTVSFLFNMVMDSLKGKSTIIPGPIREISQQFTMNALNGEIDVEDPMGDGHLKAKFGANALTSISTAMIPEGVNLLGDMAAMQAGYSVEGSLAHFGLTMDADIKDDGEAVLVSTTNSGGSMSYTTDQSSVSFLTTSTDTTATLQTSQFPLPISLKAQSQDVALDMPFATTDTVQDFGMTYALRGFEMDDMLWGMFDPTGALPRDPATVAIDLEGTGKLAIDFTDPDVDKMLADIDGPIGELETLSLKSLELDLVGARVTGDGAFTFDNSDLETFDGMPRPKGALNFELVGIDGLMSTLSSMGLLPPEQAMGARMMMGLFARPGDGPDTLTSTIEVTDDGQVLANGQRIR